MYLNFWQNFDWQPDTWKNDDMFVCIFYSTRKKIFWCLFSKNKSNSSFSNQTKGERRWKDYVWKTNEMTSSWGIWRWWYFNATWRDGDEIRHLNGRKIDKTSRESRIHCKIIIHKMLPLLIFFEWQTRCVTYWSSYFFTYTCKYLVIGGCSCRLSRQVRLE